VFTTTSLATA